MEAPAKEVGEWRARGVGIGCAPGIIALGVSMSPLLSIGAWLSGVVLFFLRFGTSPPNGNLGYQTWVRRIMGRSCLEEPRFWPGQAFLVAPVVSPRRPFLCCHLLLRRRSCLLCRSPLRLGLSLPARRVRDPKSCWLAKKKL